MKVIYKKTTELKPYANNPRHNDDAVGAVAASIKEFGFKVPVVIDAQGVVVAGHTRLKAALQIQLKEIPCIIADDLNPEQIKAYRLADNKTSELATWDIGQLEAELQQLLDIDIDMSIFGFDASVFDNVEKEVIEDDFNLHIPADPQTKPGDLYQLGRHRLLCGDATKNDDVLKLMNGKQADLLLTDPPYNIDYEGKTDSKMKIFNDNMDDGAFQEFLSAAFVEAYKILNPGAAFYIWFASSQTYNFFIACRNAGMQVRQQLIWVKNHFTLGRQDYQWKHEPCLYGWKDGASHYFVPDRNLTTLLEYDKPLRCEEHPTMKPVPMIGALISNSTKKNQIAVDFFGGAGSTMTACEQLDRTCYMMEIAPTYCDVIIERWEKLTGRKANLIN